ncbi:MAG: helix-turn-helix domain-containing protein [Deltaproteobacteria bacterium]|nr:helix-turn-helix domain-containing protein [Deltaproteobacteria bacterium]
MDDAITERRAIGERVDQLLSEKVPPWTRAHLARESGVPESTISRVSNGVRAPTIEVIEAIAKALGMSAAQLVAGTDSEDRLAEAERLVRRADYEAMRAKMIEFERRANDLDSIAAQTREALEQERARSRQLREDAARLTLERDDARREADAHEAEAHRLRFGLERAVVEITELRRQLKEVSDAVESTRRTGRIAAVLAGIAAIPVIATVSDFLRDDDEAPPPPAREDAAGRPRPTRSRKRSQR